MTDTEINIAIAKAVGAIQLQYTAGEFGPIPNYAKDLNACAEMEHHIVQAGGCYTHYVSYLQELTQHNEWRATAPQRCEAFLRATERWVISETV